MTRPVVRARLEHASETEISVSVAGPAGTGGTLTFSSPDPVWEALPPTHDFIAVALVQYAASEGCDLHVEGPVTSAQLDRLDELQTIWSVWRPDKFRRIELSRTEFALLELFLEHPRQVLTRTAIFERVWGYDFGATSNSLGVYMGYLRRKTEAGGEPRLLHTVRGVGYVLREDG